MLSLRRTFLLVAVLLIPACGGGGGGDDDSAAAPPPVTIVTYPAPGPGLEGMTVGYSNGHPLNWITDNAAILALEDQVLVLMNAHRAAQVPALPAMTMVTTLRNCARGHSRHMRLDIHDFFDHPNPEGDNPFERMVHNGISFGSAAENIAAGPTTALSVFTAWMNSPGHNANMLGNYTRVGIGYQPGAGGTDFAAYWTQVFAN